MAATNVVNVVVHSFVADSSLLDCCDCTGQPSFYIPFGLYFSLGCFHRFFASLLFCFLDKAGVFVSNSIPPVFPFFSPCLPCPFVFCLFSFSPFLFCIYYEFILAEDLCVHLPLF